MSRREDSKRERLRLEEDALNKLLRDAGLYEEGMGLEEKRSMMQLLEESRASAQQEAAEREQWRQQEEKILKETLNKSFNDNPEESAVGSSIQHDSEDSSRDSDVVAIPSGKEKVESKKSGDVSDDDSVTPDLSPVRANSPELLPPTRLFGRGPNSVTQASTSGKAGRKTVKENPRGSSQNSEEDLFCDSQSSGEQKNRQKYQECVVSDSESRGQDDSRSPLRTPGRARTVQQTLTVVRTVEKRTVTVECSTSKPSGSQQSLKRRYSVEEVTSESDGCESRVSSYSQPLSYSSLEKMKKLSPLSEDEDGIELLSPVIGKRNASSSVGGANNAKISSKSLQDAEISNSVEPKEQLDAVMVDDSDDEDLVLPTPSVSQSAKSNPTEKRASTPDGCETTKSQEAGSSKQPEQNEKVSDEDQENNDEKNNEVGCSVDSQSPRLKLRKSANEVVSQNLDMISDSDEDQSFNYQNDRKRNVNVFFPQEGSDIPLKRRRKMTSEDRNGTFFRTSKETLDDCFKRILSLMSEDMTQLEHNQLRLSYRLKWMPPLVVDKRVKDSLDRPGAHSRKKLEGISEKCLPRRAVRHTSRSVEALDEDSHHSEDSLPEIFSHEEQNAGPQSRRILKRRSLHQGLSHKRAKQAALQEDKESESGPSLENSKLACESDEEFESNSLFPQANKQEGFLHVSKPNNTFHEVSSSKSLGMRNNASDSEGENVCIVAQTSDEECAMMEKPGSSVGESQGREQASPLQPTPKITPQVRSQKRPLRNTFMLNSPSQNNEDRDCDSATSSTLPREAQSDSGAQVSQPDEPSTSGIQRAEVKTGRGRGKPTPLSKRMKPLNFVSSSGNDLEMRSSLDRHEQAGPSSNEDICILDGNDAAVASTSRSSQSSSNQVNRTGLSKREPGGRLQIRPAPLKLKKNSAREKGGEGISSRQEEKEESTEQITSSVAERRQVSNGQSTEDSREEEEAVNLVPCPLCGKLYPLKQIEVHASDCLEMNDKPEEEAVPSSSRQSKRKVNKPVQKAGDQEDLEIEEVGEMRTDRCVVVAGRGRTPPKMVRCSYCKAFINEGDDYLIHVQSCVVKQQIEKSIMSPSSESTPVSKSGFKRVGVQQKLGFHNVKSGSLFDQLEGGLVCVPGDITAPEFCNTHTALVQILNCVAVKPHGLSQTLAEKYPYSDLYSCRGAVGTFNRAKVEDRPVPGTISICRPKVPARGPVVVNVYGQFYMGKERNRNIMNKRLAKTLETCDNAHKDPTLLSGLSMDTAENRINWFREGLNELERKVVQEKISHIVFPYLIGCGLAGGKWEENYFPAIKRFAGRVKEMGIKVTVVRKTEVQKSDSEIAIVGTVKRTVITPGSPKGQNVNRGRITNLQLQLDSSISSSSIESEEEYEIPTSPIRDFVPISAQKDSLIDYHNQFKKKTQKPIVPGAVGAGAKKRGQKRRRKTKNSKNSSKKKRA